MKYWEESATSKRRTKRNEKFQFRQYISCISLKGGHSFSTSARTGREAKQKRTPCVQRRGDDTPTYVRKKASFACILLYFHISFSVVFGDGSHYCFTKTLAMIIFLSLKCSTVFFCMELLIGYLKRFSLDKGPDG